MDETYDYTPPNIRQDAVQQLEAEIYDYTPPNQIAPTGAISTDQHFDEKEIETKVNENKTYAYSPPKTPPEETGDENEAVVKEKVKIVRPKPARAVEFREAKGDKLGLVVKLMALIFASSVTCLFTEAIYFGKYLQIGRLSLFSIILDDEWNGTVCQGGTREVSELIKNQARLADQQKNLASFVKNLSENALALRSAVGRLVQESNKDFETAVASVYRWIGCDILLESTTIRCCRFFNASQARNWLDARTHCREIGANLLTVTSETENKINQLAQEYGTNDFWIGLKAHTANGNGNTTFTWDRASEVTFKKIPSNATYDPNSEKCFYVKDDQWVPAECSESRASHANFTFNSERTAG